MSENKLQKRLPDSLKEKTQYLLTFGVIGTMLLVAGFPTFVIAFFGIFAYFLWKTFIQTSPNSIREVFEFYLSANEILRSEDRRWFGFEMQEVILAGEAILQRMNGAPPLVYFTLGALYNKIGNHKAAVNHLSYVMETAESDESNYLYATPGLKEYVKILRKIEREPSEAPQTSAAIRSLERTRRNRGAQMLEESRIGLAAGEQKQLEESTMASENGLNPGKSLFTANTAENGSGNGSGFKSEISFTESKNGTFETGSDFEKATSTLEKSQNHSSAKKRSAEQDSNRKSISEVLRDIYDN